MSLAVVLAARSAEDVWTRQLRSEQGRGSLASALTANPALRPIADSVRLGRAYAGYHHRHGSDKALRFDPDRGRTLRQAGAEALMPVGKGAVWGSAAYDNGKHIDRELCLSSDYDDVYPYVNATLSGGDMRQEHYRFGGGWGGRVSPQWRLGATLSYDAGHAYRQVDPRPRNITGDLRLGFGAAFRVSRNYYLGADVTLRRYTQSNSVMFVSDMGRESVYHLTGLGTFYRRFTGLGDKMSYTGYEPGMGLQFLRRTHQGASLHVAGRYSRLHTRCVLTALNKLPMADIDQDAYSASLGWSDTRFGIRADLDGRVRHGNENIFGDATSNVYPKIGSEEMYTDTRTNLGLALSYRLRTSRSCLLVESSGTYLHRREQYDRNTRLLKADRFRAALQLTGARIFGHGIFCSVSLRGACYFRASSELVLPAYGSDTNASGPITDALLRQQHDYYNAVSGAAQTVSVAWRTSKALSDRYALGVAMDWSYLHSAAGTHFNQLTANIKFYF